MNVYRHTFVAACPADSDRIVYRLEIRSPTMIRVEDIKEATAKVVEGFHEHIADRLYAEFGGEQRMVAVHQGVTVETYRGASA